MLWNIKKVLHCHFPDLDQHLSSLTDPRKGETYTITEMVMSAIVMFLLECDSRNAFNNKSREEMFRKNYNSLFGLKLPQMDAINDLFKILDFKEMEEIRCHLISNLMEKRVFHKFRFLNQFSHIAIDGTGIYNWGENPIQSIKEQALSKESKNGKINYYSLLMEAVMVCKNGMIIPLITEWIENENPHYDKQDCESKAFKRMAVRLKKYFPRLKICILADGLYSNVSIMNICSEYNWKYITVFKDGNLPSVWEEINSLLKLSGGFSSATQFTANSTHRIKRSFNWIKDIEYQKHNLNWIECNQEMTNIETNEKFKTNRFVFLTNMDVNKNNIAKTLMAGRARWSIEDHFNTQKNRGGNLHHKFNRNNFNAIKNWHNTRQLAFLIKELVKHSIEVKELTKKYKLTWKELWEIINGYLYFCLVENLMQSFDNWIGKKNRQVRLE